MSRSCLVIVSNTFCPVNSEKVLQRDNPPYTGTIRLTLGQSVLQKERPHFKYWDDVEGGRYGDVLAAGVGFVCFGEGPGAALWEVDGSGAGACF